MKKVVRNNNRPQVLTLKLKKIKKAKQEIPNGK